MTTTTIERSPNDRRDGELLYSFDGQFTEIIPIGPVADGFRLDGHFAGTLTAGELAGAELTGVDYFRIDHDGLGIVRAHEIVTHGERTVAVELHGILRPPPGIDPPRPDGIVQPGFAWPEQPYTIHVMARFETAAPDLADLNRTVVAHSGTVNFTTGRLHVDARVVV
jgi:hypothetical protein